MSTERENEIRPVLEDSVFSTTECTGIAQRPSDVNAVRAMEENMEIRNQILSRAKDSVHPPQPGENARPYDAHNPPKTTPHARPAR